MGEINRMFLQLVGSTIIFVSLGSAYNILNQQNLDVKEFPTTVQYQETVLNAFSKINSSYMDSFLRKYSAYPNRYFNSSSGIEASEWLLTRINSTILWVNYSGSVSLRSISHPNWAQKSIIARIEGTDPYLRSEVVIIGAHLDSVNGDAPGADDNGSGSSVLLEVLSIILENQIALRRTTEFHWYAAEEIGLLGSQEIATAYSIAGINVLSMLNLDVVGWVEPGDVPHVSFVTVQTDEGFTNFLRLITTEYCTHSWTDRICANGCSSDHRSWNHLGFKAAFAIEPQQNPYMHTSDDKLDWVNLEQLVEFVKLGLGYIIELGEPIENL